MIHNHAIVIQNINFHGFIFGLALTTYNDVFQCRSVTKSYWRINDSSQNRTGDFVSSMCLQHVSANFLLRSFNCVKNRRATNCFHIDTLKQNLHAASVSILTASAVIRTLNLSAIFTFYQNMNEIGRYEFESCRLLWQIDGRYFCFYR